jgi:hypothetical protein
MRNITEDKMKALFNGVDMEKTITEWGMIKNASVGLKLTKDGLDSKIAFTNPLSVPVDDRFYVGKDTIIAKPSPTPVQGKGMDWKNIPLLIIIPAALIAALIIILVIVGLIARKRKKNNGIHPVEPPQNIFPDQNS